MEQPSCVLHVCSLDTGCGLLPKLDSIRHVGYLWWLPPLSCLRSVSAVPNRVQDECCHDDRLAVTQCDYFTVLLNAFLHVMKRRKNDNFGFRYYASRSFLFMLLVQGSGCVDGACRRSLHCQKHLQVCTHVGDGLLHTLAEHVSNYDVNYLQTTFTWSGNGLTPSISI